MNNQFEWDSHKAESNIKKHGVDFNEAKTVFDDILAYIFDDPQHSFGEKREIIIGHSNSYRLLLVYFTEKKQGIIRIFSARLATKKERKDYESNNKF